MERRFVVAQIQSLGYRTLGAGNATEALALIDQGAEIDLLFTDVMMPGSINGWQLAIEALNRRPSIKLLFTSGYAEKSLVEDRRLDAGALLLAKPYRKVELAKMIRRALLFHESDTTRDAKRATTALMTAAPSMRSQRPSKSCCDRSR